MFPMLRQETRVASIDLLKALRGRNFSKSPYLSFFNYAQPMALKNPLPGLGWTQTVSIPINVHHRQRERLAAWQRVESNSRVQLAPARAISIASTLMMDCIPWAGWLPPTVHPEGIAKTRSLNLYTTILGTQAFRKPTSSSYQIKYMKSCPACASSKPRNHKPYGRLQPVPNPSAPLGLFRRRYARNHRLCAFRIFLALVCQVPRNRTNEEGQSSIDQTISSLRSRRGKR